MRRNLNIQNEQQNKTQPKMKIWEQWLHTIQTVIQDQQSSYGVDITPGLIPAHIQATVTHSFFLHKIRRFQPWQTLPQWFLPALTNNLDTECTACLIARLISCCVSNGNFANWQKKWWYESWGNVNWDLLQENTCYLKNKLVITTLVFQEMATE